MRTFFPIAIEEGFISNCLGLQISSVEALFQPKYQHTTSLQHTINFHLVSTVPLNLVCGFTTLLQFFGTTLYKRFLIVAQLSYPIFHNLNSFLVILPVISYITVDLALNIIILPITSP